VPARVASSGRSAAVGRGAGARTRPDERETGVTTSRRRATVDAREVIGPREGAGPRDWDARAYDRVADPMARWGRMVLDRAGLVGNERVLDAGCGSGRVTEQLLERWPGVRVVALDGSPAMVEAARARLAPFGGRVEFVVADLGRPLPVGIVDAVISTATFHWVPDHDALFRNLAAVLRPGGRLIAQFGGEGNIASVLAILATVGDGWLGPAHFESVDATVRRLEAAGFVDVQAWLRPEPTDFEPGEPFRDFLRTVVLGAHLDRIPEADREAFVRSVAERMPAPRIDYVRLNVLARLPG
jgi:trans-aconitate 2-methyltransferase